MNKNTRWLKLAKKTVLGKKVISVRYMSKQESCDLGWNYRPIILEFDDGTYLFPSMDEEGNGAGCLLGGNYNNPEITLRITIPKLPEGI
jgi:hypothetical protein